MPLLLDDFTHARTCKPFCEKYLTLPRQQNIYLYTRSDTFSFVMYHTFLNLGKTQNNQCNAYYH